MAKNIQKQEPAGLTLGDVVYVLAKHKWKIILPTLLALGGAAAYYLKAPAVYESKAQLLVRYVVNRNALDEVDTTSTPGNSRGVDAVLVSQIAILQSRDLARSVVDLLQGKKDETDADSEKANLQPDPKLLSLISPDSPKATLENDATSVIVRGITATASKGGNILEVKFKHPDPAVASRVLDVVIKQYLAKHLAIYRSKVAAADILAEVKKSQDTLKRTEGELLKLRAEKEILTLDGAIASLNAEIVEARGQLGEAEAGLAEQQARVAALMGATGAAGVSPESKTTGADAVDTKETLPEPGAAKPSAAPRTGATTPPATTPTTPAAAGRNPLAVDGTLTRYQAVLSRLSAMRTENVALLSKFTADSEAVKLNQSQISALEREQASLEKEHPELLALGRGPAGAGPGLDLVSEQAALKAAEVRKIKLEERIKVLEKKRFDLIQDAPTIADAERNQAINEENHKYLMTSKKKAELDQKLNSDNIPNIDIIQYATPGIQDMEMRNKIALGIAGGGPALATALVLLFGLLLNRTIKRPAEFEEKLGFPLMVAIPYFKSLANGKSPLRLNGGREETKQLTAPDGTTPPWDPDHCIRPHAEAVRDRLGLFFEVNGIDHKPKLIAVTGQSPGAGASTVASGIAAALSETGDGKVLLVDMGGTRGAAHPFFDGRPAPALSTALRSSRGAEEAADNLFLAKADGTAAGPQSIGASRLSRLMPDLKASYFDYIIFDMPPLGNTSPTPAMAAFMDQVLVVVEAETSTREEILRQHRDLVDSHAKVSTVLNKVRPYGPKTLVGNL